MEIFVHQQNLLFFRKQLAKKQSRTCRLQLVKLLAEEEAKDRQQPDDPEWNRNPRQTPA
jgi:hypothetical protein